MNYFNKSSLFDKRPALLRRGDIMRDIRAWFTSEGFIEVETPIVQISPGNETHLHAFSTIKENERGEKQQVFLHTSPEFAMKKLLAAGETKIFQFAKVFRNKEGSKTHLTEFTMLEWYRVGEPYEKLQEDCLALLKIAGLATTSETISFETLFKTYANIDLNAALTENGLPLLENFQQQARKQGFKIADDDSWSDIFSKILLTIEPNVLTNDKPLFLDKYPLPEAALAKPSNNPRYAERFELFFKGIELCNAFGELTNAKEQRIRFEKDMDLKEKIYGERYPIDEEFIACLDHLPPCCGAAMGFDRLVMLATNTPKIQDVVWQS